MGSDVTPYATDHPADIDTDGPLLAMCRDRFNTLAGQGQVRGNGYTSPRSRATVAWSQ